MGTNTKILLPYYTQTEKVFEVIQKVTGCEFYQDSFVKNWGNPSKNPTQEKEKFDPLLPAGPENRWHMKKVNNENRINTSRVDMLQFIFKDIAGNDHYTNYFTEMDDEYLRPGEKYLNPNASAIWVAIGKRLVDFFGGKMLFMDSSDEDDLNNWYIGKKAKYGKRSKNMTNNERWDQYQNALFNEKLLHSNELIWGSQYAPMHQRDKKLHEYLLKLENAHHLENLIKEKDQVTKKLKL